MPRASRYLIEGYTYHLTHRCHNRSFLLRFAKDRDVYRHWLRIADQLYKVPVYGFCITSNHTHVIVHVNDAEAVGNLMGLTASASAQQYNKRKNRSGSLWEHPYQCTIVEDGQHLLNCLLYVDLNMVRAGVVSHPKDWDWCGFDELMGLRKRYRVVDVDRLLESLDLQNVRELRQMHEEGIEERINRQRLDREAHWTESLAVGSQPFVEQMQDKYWRRREFTIESVNRPGQESQWTIRETRCSYS